MRRRSTPTKPMPNSASRWWPNWSRRQLPARQSTDRYSISRHVAQIRSAPPHFHALYGEFEALIDIRTLEVIAGSLPRRAMQLVIEWAIEHRSELMEDWNLCQAKQLPKKIAPLE